MALSRRGHLVK